MNTDVALFWMQESLRIGFLLVAPLLGAALLVGVVVSLFQAITSMQEMTLSYIPKMIAIAAVLLVLAPWMLETLTDFTIHVITFIPNVSH